MALGGDIRQQIILALESQGADVGAAILQLMKGIRDEQDVVNKQWSEGSISVERFVASQAKLNKEFEKWRGILGEVRDIEFNPTVEALGKIDVTLNSLIVNGLKFQEVLRGDKEEADALAASADKFVKIDVALNSLIVSGLKFQDVLRKSVITIDDLTDSAQKLKSDKIDQFHKNTDQLTKALEASVISTDQLTQSAQKLKSDQIHNFYVNTKQVQQALEDAIIPLDHLIMSGLNLQNPTKQFGGFASAADQAADKTKKMGYAAMNASYLVQDMQYGVGAVANNIGLMATSMGNAMPKLDSFITKIGVPGGMVGLGAGVMLAAVAFDVLHKNWEPIVAALGAGIPPKIINDVKSLEDELAKLTDKKWKTSVDFNDIEVLEKKMAQLKKDKADFEGVAGKKTKEQAARADLITDAIVEHGGGGDFTSGAENLAHAVEGLMPLVDSKAATDARKRMQDLREQYAGEDLSLKPGEAIPIYGKKREFYDAQKKLEAEQAAARENRQLSSQMFVGALSQGRDDARRKALELLDRDPRAFANRGIDVEQFRAGLTKAAPGVLARKADEDFKIKDAEVQRKAEKDEALRIDNEAKAAKAKRESAESSAKTSATSKAITAIFPGVDEDLEKEFFDLDKQGLDKNQAKAALQGKIRAIVADPERRVRQDIIDEVTDALLNKGFDLAENLKLEKKKPRLDLKRIAGEGKDQAGLKAAANKIDDTFVPQIQGNLAFGAKNGLNEAEILNNAKQYIMNQGFGAQMAEEITRRGYNEFMNEFAKAMGLMNDRDRALDAVWQDAAADIQRLNAGLQRNNERVFGKIPKIKHQNAPGRR